MQIEINLFAGAAAAAGLEKASGQVPAETTLGQAVRQVLAAALGSGQDTAAADTGAGAQLPEHLEQVLAACSFLADGKMQPASLPVGQAGMKIDVLPPFAGG